MKLYSTKQAAAHLGLGEPALKYHVYQGNIRPQKIGHSLIFTQAQLDEFQSNRRPQGRPRSRKKGWISITIEDDGRVHCVECNKILNVTLADLNGAGSAPVCAKCAGMPED